MAVCGVCEAGVVMIPKGMLAREKGDFGGIGNHDLVAIPLALYVEKRIKERWMMEK